MYCKECGYNMGKLKICPACSCDNRTKSQAKAGILQLMLGGIGLGRFYLGYKTIALAQILANLCTCGIAGTVWGFVDGILILNGSVKEDAKGNPLD